MNKIFTRITCIFFLNVQNLLNETSDDYNLNILTLKFTPGDTQGVLALDGVIWTRLGPMLESHWSTPGWQHNSNSLFNSPRPLTITFQFPSKTKPLDVICPSSLREWHLDYVYCTPRGWVSNLTSVWCVQMDGLGNVLCPFCHKYEIGGYWNEPNNLWSCVTCINEVKRLTNVKVWKRLIPSDCLKHTVTRWDSSYENSRVQ